MSSATQHGRRFGLNHGEMVGEFWIEVPGRDADGEEVEIPVHCFVLRPMGWRDAKNRDKKWPWILMPHGGPEASYLDAWSTRVSSSGQSSSVLLLTVDGQSGTWHCLRKKVTSSYVQILLAVWATEQSLPPVSCDSPFTMFTIV